MPELPEVEIIVRQLQKQIVGKTIARVTVHKKKMFVGDTKRLVGSVITRVLRRAKMIILVLSTGDVLVIHLKMTGQVLVGTANETQTVTFDHEIPFAGRSLPAKTTHIILDLNDQGKLFFNDNRQFGWMKVMSKGEWSVVAGQLGPEPLAKTFSSEVLGAILNTSKRPIKIILMDPTKIAGIGNIYANEALWRAGIYPASASDSVVKRSPEKVSLLHAAIQTILQLAITNQGSSASDEAFVNAHGEKGNMQHHFTVYHKTGTPCPRCQTKIRAIRLGGRGTFYCPVCQKEPEKE